MILPRFRGKSTGSENPGPSERITLDALPTDSIIEHGFRRSAVECIWSSIEGNLAAAAEHEVRAIDN